jgi:hypothetical protein
VTIGIKHHFKNAIRNPDIIKIKAIKPSTTPISLKGTSMNNSIYKIKNNKPLKNSMPVHPTNLL